MTDNLEFQEIGHSGGQFIVEVKTNELGQRAYSIGMQGSKPNAMSMVGVYSLPQGIPVGMIRLGGIGQAFNPPPFKDCLTIFVSSDRFGKFGHECPSCNSYWRSDGPSAISDMICPYCGVIAGGHMFFTKGQKAYIEGCCNLIFEAMASPNDGKKIIDMDKVADACGKNCEKPKFYYADESQQKRFHCQNCKSFNDILGRFGYCSRCGKHNGLKELTDELQAIKDKKGSGGYNNCLREAVACFDSVARCYAKQFVERIPMTEKRKKDWSKKLFHNLELSAKDLKESFDVVLFSNIDSKDIDFLKRMFCRRHVYEHNGGEVDKKYIDESGDNSVRVKQVIYENATSVNRTIELIQRLGENFDKGFHSIFPLIEEYEIFKRGRSNVK